jgi:hypothetical protein
MRPSPRLRPPLPLPLSICATAAAPGAPSPALPHDGRAGAPAPLCTAHTSGCHSPTRRRPQRDCSIHPLSVHDAARFTGRRRSARRHTPTPTRRRSWMAWRRSRTHSHQELLRAREAQSAAVLRRLDLRFHDPLVRRRRSTTVTTTTTMAPCDLARLPLRTKMTRYMGRVRRVVCLARRGGGSRKGGGTSARSATSASLARAAHASTRARTPGPNVRRSSPATLTKHGLIKIDDSLRVPAPRLRQAVRRELEHAPPLPQAWRCARR